MDRPYNEDGRYVNNDDELSSVGVGRAFFSPIQEEEAVGGLLPIGLYILYILLCICYNELLALCL